MINFKEYVNESTKLEKNLKDIELLSSNISALSKNTRMNMGNNEASAKILPKLKTSLESLYKEFSKWERTLIYENNKG